MRKYKPKFLPLYLLVILLGVPFEVLLISVDPELTFQPKMFLIALPFGLIAGAIVLLVFNHFLLYIEIDSSGICARNTWGIKQKLKWAEINNCRPFNFMGIRFVRLYGSGFRWGIWIPEFLSNKKEFLKLVLGFLPPSCPLREHYENTNPNKANAADS